MDKVQRFPHRTQKLVLAVMLSILLANKSSFEILCFLKDLCLLCWSACLNHLAGEPQPHAAVCGGQCPAVPQRAGSVSAHLGAGCEFAPPGLGVPVEQRWLPRAFCPLFHLALPGAGHICTLTSCTGAVGQRSSSCELGQKKKVK